MPKILLFALLVFFFFTSCTKSENPIVLPPANGSAVMQVNMGEKYDYQFFVNLDEQKIAYTSPIDNWELALSSTGNENTVYLNGAKGMACYNTLDTNFNAINASDTSKADFQWVYDKAALISDSAAIGKWNIGAASKRQVYIIKINAAGTELRKLRIVSADIFEYVIEVGDINSNQPTRITIPKNAFTNFVYFSFFTLKTVDNIEPASNTWDIVFTRYNYTFYTVSPALNYVVVGALLNNSNTIAYKDSLHSYTDINKELAQSLTYSTHRDAIGFEWKKYDFNLGNYTIVPNYNYIIKTQKNRYYKLRFIDFYSTTGVKGSPKFEFQPLL